MTFPKTKLDMCRNILFLMCSCFLFHACQSIQDPELTGFTPISVKKVDRSEVILGGQLTYFNPNPIGGRLDQIFLKVYANDVHVSDISQQLDSEIKPRAEFIIPIDIHIPLQSLLKDKGGLLGGIVNVLTQKQVTLKYVGTATLRFGKLELPLVIDKEEEIRIKL